MELADYLKQQGFEFIEDVSGWKWNYQSPKGYLGREGNDGFISEFQAALDVLAEFPGHREDYMYFCTINPSSTFMPL